MGTVFLPNRSGRGIAVHNEHSRHNHNCASQAQASKEGRPQANNMTMDNKIRCLRCGTEFGLEAKYIRELEENLVLTRKLEAAQARLATAKKVMALMREGLQWVVDRPDEFMQMSEEEMLKVNQALNLVKDALEQMP